MKIILVIWFFSTGIMGILKEDQNEALKKSMANGKEIYVDFCVTCHKVNGEGTLKIVPPLVKSDYLKKYQLESIRSVKYGQQGKIVVNGIEYNGVMPNPRLEDEEVADVMNYINNSWGNKIPGILTAEKVSKIENK